MLPLLTMMRDRREISTSEMLAHLVTELDLTEADMAELIPSGAKTVFHDRASWARTYLKKSLLIHSPARGRFKISDRGLSVLDSGPPRIDNAYLRRFPEFLEFTGRENISRVSLDRIIYPASEAVKSSPPELANVQTPEEALETNYLQLRAAMVSELLERMLQAPPAFFERLVVDVLVAMGYGGSHRDAGKAIGRSGDDGIDGIIKEDRLGLDAIYIQAKRWRAPVGAEAIRAFAGSLMGQKASKGVLITTSRFTADAKDFTDRIDKRIVLIDGDALAQMMIDHGVGVSTTQTYVLKKIDEDYFGE